MNRRRMTRLIIIFACLLFGVSGLKAQTANLSSPDFKPGQDLSAKTVPEVSVKAPVQAKPAVAAPNAAITAKPVAGEVGKGKPVAPKYDVEDFSFSSEVFRNPFEPILLLKAKTSRGLSVKALRGAASEGKTERADKLDYELEELRLVGIIKSDTGMIAMMEDSQGKGVFFRKGDNLNRNLWVMDVSAKTVMLGYKAKGEIKKIAVDIPTKN